MFRRGHFILLNSADKAQCPVKIPCHEEGENDKRKSQRGDDGRGRLCWSPPSIFVEMKAEGRFIGIKGKSE